MSDAVKDGGGTMKSAPLTALPVGVATEMRPDAVADGIVVEILVEDAEPMIAWLILTVALSLAELLLKFVPVMVTDVPAAPTVGEKLVMVGAPRLFDPTVNEVLLVAEPAGLVTTIGPVVAPVGTVVTIKLVLDAESVALTPLKVTLFWLAVAL
jgi:hypothetical protein